jgi:hypothetical protein
MHRLIMATGILSMITLAGAGGALAYWSWSQPTHAGFVRDYLMNLEPEEQEKIRTFLATSAEKGKITDEAMRDYLIDEEMQARVDAMGAPGEQLLLQGVTGEAPTDHRDDLQAAIDRMASRAQSYDSVRGETERLRKEAQDAKEQSDRVLREWNEKQKNARLMQLVSDLDRTREPESILPQLQFLPLSDLYFVLTQSKNVDNRAAIVGALPEEVQRSLATLGSNPAGLSQN